MMRIVGPIMLVVLMAAMMFLGLQEYLIEGNSWDRKISQAKSILYYEVTPQKPLRMKVFQADTQLRLLSHLLLSESWDYDPDKRHVYCLHVAVKNFDDSLAWEHEYWIETRQSKAERRENLWAQECVFTTSGTQVSDDRVTYVIFPEEILKTEATMEVTLRGQDEGVALLRVYRPMERSGMAISKTALTMFDDTRQKMAERVFRAEWRELTPFEREQVLSTQWERVPPEGVSGVNYSTRQVYFTGFHLPVDIPAPEDGFYLAPGMALAVNALGPAKIEVLGQAAAPLPGFSELKLNTAKPEPPPGPEPVKLQIRRILSSGQVEENIWSSTVYGGHFRAVGEINVPKAEFQGLSIFNEGTNPVRIAPLLVAGKQEAILGKVQFLPFSKKSTGEFIQPEQRYFDGFLLDPERGEISYKLFAGKQSGGTVMRMVTYPLMPQGQQEDLEYSISTILEDDEGKQVFAGSVLGLSLLSPFEDLPREDPDKKLGVGEAQVSFLRIPQGAFTLKMQADKPVIVILQAPVCLYCEEQLNPEFAQNVEPLKWRNEEQSVSRWSAVFPEYNTDLAREGRRITIRAQSRLELPPEPEINPVSLYEVIEPGGVVRSSPMLEQARDTTELRGGWKYGNYTEVKTDVEYGIVVPREFIGRPALLQFNFDNMQSLGASVEIFIDGKKLVKRKARMLSGSFPIAVLAGKHKLKITCDRGPVRLWINLPVNGAKLSDHYFQRTVFKLERGKRLSFNARHRAGTKQSLNVLIYQAGDPSYGRVIARFDGGRPKMRNFAIASGVSPSWKAYRLSYQGKSRSLLKSARGRKISRSELMLMTLFEESSAGKHRLSLGMNSGPDAVWVRVFAVTENVPPGKGYLVWSSTKR